MICHIIGLGNSGSKWNGQGFSIGVNDSWVFGNPTNHLVVINNNFSIERQDIINQSTPDVFWSHMKSWAHRKDYHKLEMIQWYGKLEDHVYHSNNSPFVAVTLAFKMGYKEIVLWGVDFTDHKTIREDNGKLDRALKDYATLQKELVKKGAYMFVGEKGRLPLALWK